MVDTERSINFTDGGNPVIAARVKFGNYHSWVAVIDSYCTNPDCDCRDVTLRFFELTDNKYGDKLFEIIINVDTWKAVKCQILRRDLDCEGMIGEFLSDIDKETRLKIKKRFDDGKKFGGEVLKGHIDYDAIRKEGVVNYPEVFNSRDYDKFLFENKGVRYAVLDSYCTNPKCNCNDVVLAFYKIGSSTGASSCLFALRVKFKTRKFEVEDKIGEINSQEIKEIYDCFMAHLNNPGFELLKKRYSRMKQLKTVLGLNAAMTGIRNSSTEFNEVKAGRNAPCPCGSGRKYKKCCGEK